VTDVYIEAGNKRVFACAYDWPGWARSGKDESNAMQALASYAERYAPVATRAGEKFSPKAAATLRVVERVRGSANTDFGVPHEIAKRDTTPLSAAEAKRMSSLVKAAWAIFDAVAAEAPPQLRKGPRGGGRDRDKIVEHVVGADGVYAKKLGVGLAVPGPRGSAAMSKFRQAVLKELEKPSKGEPLIERGWPQRYAARRIAWHALDHAWEIEDRSDGSDR
jgi:hypothetical protein